MSRVPLALAGVAFATAVVAASAGGCSLIVAFDPIDAGKDSETEEPDPVTRRDSGRDPDLTPAVVDASPGGEVDARPSRVPPCDPTFRLEEFDCKYPSGKTIPRPNCAKNDSIFTTYPRERGGDLVLCDGGAHPTCVRRCPAGCVVMPDGHPDQCDDCEGRVDGLHCGRDLEASPPENADLAFDCKAGVGVEESGRLGCLSGTPCAAENCSLSGVCQSKCEADTPPGPACCAR